MKADRELRVLHVGVLRADGGARVEGADGVAGHEGLGVADVLAAEEELAVEVGHVDGVEVDDGEVEEARQHERLQQLTADAARTHHQHARTLDGVEHRSAVQRADCRVAIIGRLDTVGTVTPSTDDIEERTSHVAVLDPNRFGSPKYVTRVAVVSLLHTIGQPSLKE